MIGMLVALGMLVLVPLGLRLIDTAGGPVGVIAQAWPLAALAGIASLIVGRGEPAVVLAVIYAALTVALAVAAAERLWRRRSLAPSEIAVLTAMVSPSIAGISLVAERGGWQLFGFDMTVLALTVAHFHFAGFAAALIAGLVYTAAPGVLSALPPVAVPFGIAVVFAGYFTTDAVEFGGTVILTAGMWLTAWLIWQRVRPQAASRFTRLLFGISAGALVVTMLLALNWAAGEVWDAVPHLSLDAMAATYGIVNAVFFALVGVIAWRRVQRERSLGLRMNRA